MALDEARGLLGRRIHDRAGSGASELELLLVGVIVAARELEANHVLELHRSGKLKVLAVTHGTRLLAAPDLPGPKETEPFPVPGNDRRWFDDHQGRFPVTPHTTQAHPENSVSRPHFYLLRRRTTQHAELMPQGEILEPQFGRGPK